MLSILIKNNAHNKIAAKLRSIGQNFSNPRGLYARWGVTALRWIDENFRRQGALLAEGAWKPLSSSTIRSRTRKGKQRQARKGGGGYKTLMVTGALRSSYSTKFDREGVIIGSSKNYAIYHESDKPRRVIPQRRMLPRQKDESFTERLSKVALNYVKETIRGS